MSQTPSSSTDRCHGAWLQPQMHRNPAASGARWLATGAVLMAAAILGSTSAGNALQESTNPKPSMEMNRGTRLYALNCAACHGADGNSNREFNAPAMAGQKEWYLIRQLQNFRDKTRGAHPQDLQGQQMTEILRLLETDEDIEQIVAHVSSMPPFKVSPVLDGDPARGQMLFATCLACHGQNGEGNLLVNAPRIAGQADWYIVQQLKKFKEGIRGANAKDIHGMQMAAMAQTVADEQAMHDLAAYINSLQ